MAFKDYWSWKYAGLSVVVCVGANTIYLPLATPHYTKDNVAPIHATGEAFLRAADQITVPSSAPQIINIAGLKGIRDHHIKLPTDQVTRDGKNLIVFPEQASAVKNNLTECAQLYLQRTLPSLQAKMPTASQRWTLGIVSTSLFMLLGGFLPAMQRSGRRMKGLPLTPNIIN